MSSFFLKRVFLLAPAVMCVAFTLFSPYAAAYQKGDILLGVGVGVIDPREDSDTINLGGIELGKIGVESQSVPLVNVSYFVTDHLAFELLLSKPPTVDLVGTTGLVKGVPIGGMKAYPLVVTARYFFMDSHSRWQPFVGLGFNYVVPGTTKVNPDLPPLFGADTIEIEVEHSWGVTLSAGLDFMMTEKLTISAQAYYMDVEGKANGKVIIGDQELDVELFTQTSLAPVLFSLTLGYVF